MLPLSIPLERIGKGRGVMRGRDEWDQEYAPISRALLIRRSHRPVLISVSQAQS
jgi:hypothetical protein